jgi:BAG domain
MNTFNINTTPFPPVLFFIFIQDMFTTYQLSEPYPTGYALDPFQSSYSYYAMQQEVKRLYRQQLIEQERRRQAAAMEQAIIAAYKRERIMRAAKELAYQQEVAERRRRQYEDYYQNQLLNNFLGNLLSEKNEDEEMNDDCCAYDYEAMQCNKRARLYHNEPKQLYKRQYTSPRKLHHRRKYQQPQDDDEVWLLIQHLKSVDENEAAEASQSTAALADKNKGKGKAVERDVNVTKETSSQAPASNEEHPAEDNTLVNVETVLRKLKAIGEKLDGIKEQHESIVLATPLTFDTESEDLSRSAPNKEFFSYEDDIMKVLLELDAVESYGLEDIRNQRKALVAKSENLLKIIDEYKQKEWERASASSGAESDTEVDKDISEELQVEASEDTQVEDTEDTQVITIEDQTEPIETEEQETTSLTGQAIDTLKESNVQGLPSEAAETSETQLSETNVDAPDEDMQVDTTADVIAEEATSSSVEEVAVNDQDDSEPIEDEKQLPENAVSSEEDLDFEKIDSATAASNEPSSSITNQPHTPVTEDEFEMVDDQDVPFQNSPQSDQRLSNQEQTSSKPLQIPIEWGEN